MQTKALFLSAFFGFLNISYACGTYAASTLPADGHADWSITDTSIGESPVIYSDQSGLKFGISVSSSHLLHVDVTDNAHKISSGSWKIGPYAIALLQDASESGHFGADIPGPDTKAFVHNFTAAPFSIIHLSDGTSPQISLAGSSVAIDALNKYVDTHGVVLPPPFAQPHIADVTEAASHPPALTQDSGVYPSPPEGVPHEDRDLSGTAQFLIVIVAIVLAFVIVKIGQGISRSKQRQREREINIAQGMAAAAARQKVIDEDNARTNDALHLCLDEIKSKSKILAMKWRQNIYQDDYGTIITKKWEPEIPSFINSRIIPLLRQHDLMDKWAEIQEIVLDEINRVASETLPDVIPKEPKETGPEVFSPTMDPYDYEEHCAILLRRIGWNARATVASGDQGADVIADKDGKKIVLQCKLYSSPVGNDAVQQAFSAMGYYDCTHSAVVSNAGFTASARQLAGKNGVTLLNHDQLQDYAHSVDR
ncbi:restriction endonuclease [Komagataeibacter intermedius]|uniref:restriction endonuclease n=1 Tax=Komagataeibacter intermedius TaxID=66229 RepID=UPI003B42E823